MKLVELTITRKGLLDCIVECSHGEMPEQSETVDSVDMKALSTFELPRWGAQVRNYVLQPYTLVKEGTTANNSKL